MLADVLKEKDKVRLERLAENERLKKQPIEEDIVLYFPRFNKIGGIETWIYNLSQLYDFTLVYEGGDEKQIERIKNKKIRYVGQDIKCNSCSNQKYY